MTVSRETAQLPWMPNECRDPHHRKAHRCAHFEGQYIVMGCGSDGIDAGRWIVALFVEGHDATDSFCSVATRAEAEGLFRGYERELLRPEEVEV